MAKIEEEKLTADLLREPTNREKLFIEQAAALTVRVRHLRERGRHLEADNAARVLFTALDKLRQQRSPRERRA